MPPKRKPAGKARPSKLAKEHNITVEEEAEIKEAFSLFAEEMADVGDTLMPTEDLGSALDALGLHAAGADLQEFKSIVDPDNEGNVPYEPFVAICAAQMHRRDNDDGTREAEREAAFALFASGGTGAGADNERASAATSLPDRITMAHLKRVSALLKMDVSDDMLRDMILEANGGAGVARGVSRAEFTAVMKRIGV